MNLRDEIRDKVSGLVEEWVGAEDKFEVEVTRTQVSEFGDYSTNAALKLATKLKQNPVEIAKKMADSFADLPYIEKLEVKNPGFLNFFIKDEYWQEQVKQVLDRGAKFGSNDFGKGKKARVEFVSANPTGPLHFGNARGGPIGDVLASVLEFNGYKVVREYYTNDVGVQITKLGESILNVSQGKSAKDQEYKGDYVVDLANKIKVSDAEEAGKKAAEILSKEAIEVSGEVGIHFDEVYRESGFIESGETKADIDHLREKGILKEKDGALWLAPNDDFLKDRETVLVKSDGSYTYFANDIAYHDLKFKDKPDLVIDIFGANHHGHIPRLQAAISALGYDERKFFVILYQWVRFKKGPDVIKMSKRSGTFITAREVLDEIGKDAVRFFLLMHDANSPIDFDLDLAREKSSKNPVYYVQYAGARIESIMDKLKVKGKKQKDGEANYQLLTNDYELALIKEIAKLPELIEDTSKSFAVHHLTAYAVDLADAFHRFYENCKLVGEEEELMRARLGLLQATQVALQNTLKLLGVSAPRKM